MNDNHITLARAAHKDSFDCKKGRFNGIPDVRWASSESGTPTWECNFVMISGDSICVPWEFRRVRLGLARARGVAFIMEGVAGLRRSDTQNS